MSVESVTYSPERVRLALQRSKLIRALEKHNLNETLIDNFITSLSQEIDRHNTSPYAAENLSLDDLLRALNPRKILRPSTGVLANKEVLLNNIALLANESPSEVQPEYLEKQLNNWNDLYYYDGTNPNTLLGTPVQSGTWRAPRWALHAVDVVRNPASAAEHVGSSIKERLISMSSGGGTQTRKARRSKARRSRKAHRSKARRSKAHRSRKAHRSKARRSRKAHRSRIKRGGGGELDNIISENRQLIGDLDSIMEERPEYWSNFNDIYEKAIQRQAKLDKPPRFGFKRFKRETLIQMTNAILSDRKKVKEIEQIQAQSQQKTETPTMVEIFANTVANTLKRPAESLTAIVTQAVPDGLFGT